MTYKPGDVVLRLDGALTGLWEHECRKFKVDPASPKVVVEFFEAHGGITLEGMINVIWQTHRFCPQISEDLEGFL